MAEIGKGGWEESSSDANISPKGKLFKKPENFDHTSRGTFCEKTKLGPG